LVTLSQPPKLSAYLVTQLNYILILYPNNITTDFPRGRGTNSHISDKCKASIFSSIAAFHPKLDSVSQTVLGIEIESKDVMKE